MKEFYKCLKEIDFENECSENKNKYFYYLKYHQRNVLDTDYEHTDK